MTEAHVYHFVCVYERSSFSVNRVLSHSKLQECSLSHVVKQETTFPMLTTHEALSKLLQILCFYFSRIRVILVPVVPGPKNIKDLIDSYNGNVEVSHFLFITYRRVRETDRRLCRLRFYDQ